MDDPLKKPVIIGVAAVALVVLGYAFGLTLSGQEYAGIFIFLLLGVGLVYWMSLREKKDVQFEEARRRSAAYFTELTHETATIDNLRGTRRYVLETKFYAFRFPRMMGERMGEASIIVVSVDNGGKWDFADFIDNPSEEEKKNPFLNVEGYLHSTAVPTAEAYSKALDIQGSFGQRKELRKMNKPGQINFNKPLADEKDDDGGKG